jgi:membrane protein implicated in regulation of membrane protease activity
LEQGQDMSVKEYELTVIHSNQIMERLAFHIVLIGCSAIALLVSVSDSLMWLNAVLVVAFAFNATMLHQRVREYRQVKQSRDALQRLIVTIKELEFRLDGQKD